MAFMPGMQEWLRIEQCSLLYTILTKEKNLKDHSIETQNKFH